MVMAVNSTMTGGNNFLFLLSHGMRSHVRFSIFWHPLQLLTAAVAVAVDTNDKEDAIGEDPILDHDGNDESGSHESPAVQHHIASEPSLGMVITQNCIGKKRLSGR